MRRKRLITGLGLLSVCSLLFTVSTSLMWFDNRTKVTPDQIVGSSDGAYYASGDGSKDNPYVINQPRHLYNLAWLQYLGTYNKDTDNDGSIDEVYFKVEGNTTNSGGDSVLDMSGWVLPPIGTEDNPFVGNFNGNNTIIKNLTISNTFSDYGTAHPYYNADGNQMTEDNFTEPQIIGFFGVVGPLDASTTYEVSSSTTESVYDTYVDNITIQNKNSTSSTKEVLAGLIAGYVNAPIIRCGVGYGEFNFASGTVNLSSKPTGSVDIKGVSNYSLIGAYNPNKFSYSGLPTDSSGSGSGDAGYLTSINIRTLNDDLISYGQTDNNNGVIKAGVAIPFQEASNASFTSKSGTITVGGRTVTNASTVSVSTSATNIGYYVGGTVASNVDSVATMRVFKDHYTSSTINYDNIQVSGNSDVKTVPDRVKTYLQKTVSGDIQQGYSVIRMGTPNTLSTTMTSDSGYYGIENGKVGSYSGNILVPNNCIWVAPVKAGTFEFVCTTENTKASYLNIWKLKRSTPKDYSSSLSTPDLNNQATNFTSDSSAEVVGMQVYPTSSPYNAYYYGTPITDDDINNGVEFAITLFGYQFMSPSIFITYIDVGSDGGDSSGSTTPTTTSPTEIDFVYYDSSTKKLVKITSEKDSDGNYIYKNSEVVFQIGSTASGTVAFKRTYVDSTSIVYYYISNSSITITSIGTGKSEDNKKEIDEN